MTASCFSVHRARLMALVVGLSAGVAASQTRPLPERGVLQEVWTRIKGNNVAALTSHKSYKKAAREARILRRFAAESLGDNYGARYSALLAPPDTGEYTFWIASDDASQLWLSTDDRPEHLQQIASVKGYTSREAWDATRAQKSQPILLAQGKRYFIRVLHKEGGGDDHLSVAWQGPQLARRVIRADHLHVPPMDKRTRSLVRRTHEAEQNLARLQASLAGTRPEDLEAFARRLPKNDQRQLAAGLFELAGKAARKLNTDTAARLKVYGRLTSRIVPTPGTPVENPVLRALLVLEDLYLKTRPVDELEKMGPHRAARAFGAIPEGAATVKKTLLLSSSGTKRGAEMVSTGLYALPGKPVVVTIPRALVAKKLSLQIGHHLNGKQKTRAFDCMPQSSRRFHLSEVTTKAINPHGGLLFVQAPEKVGLTDAPFTFEGALEAPRFILGKTTDEEWKTLRNNPGPWGELIADNFILLAQSEALRQLDNPTELMTWWSDTVAAHEGFYNYAIGKPFRIHTVYYAIMGVSTWPLYETKKSVLHLLNLKQMKAYHDGLFLHEHGHHCDSSEMMFGNIGESTCNWAGYYMKGTRGDFAWKDTEDTHMLRLFDRTDKLHQGLLQDNWWTTKWTHYWSYPTTSMMVGYVQGFGWEAFKTVVHRFTHKDDPVNALPMFDTPSRRKKWWARTAEDRKALDRAKIDKWLIFLSEEAKHDVRPYFAHFYLRPSPEAAKRMDAMKLPKWDLVYAPERRIIIAPNQAVAIPSPLQDALTYAEEIELAGMGKPAHGALTTGREGTHLYRPAKGFLGADRISFQITNEYGNIFRNDIKIFVVAEKVNPWLALGRVDDVAVGEWKKIAFPRAYREPVIVAAIDLKKHPNFITRIRNVSSTGCEITLQQIKGDPDNSGCDATWCVMEAGMYSKNTSGLDADVGVVRVIPERISAEAKGVPRSYEDRLTMLRAATLGQVQTFHDPKWSRFFWRGDRDILGIRVGCHYGTEETPRKEEMVGYLKLSQGLYQFGNTTVRIGSNRIESGGLSLRLDYASFNRWGFRGVARHFETN